MDFSPNDLMAGLEILERLERTATSLPCTDEAPSEAQIQRWQTLFGYSRAEAVQKIQKRNEDLNRLVLNDELWEDIRAEQERKGFDKEAYEHFLESLAGARAGAESEQAQDLLDEQADDTSSSSATYLMKLEGSLSTPEQVQALTGSSQPPKVSHDLDDTSARFVHISSSERRAIASKISPLPVFIHLGTPPARKELDANSQHPILGVEATLPQHRCNTDDELVRPCQEEYPVWYFFYGTLTDPEILGAKLGVEEDLVELVPAQVAGGVLGKWGDRYFALLDGEPSQKVAGFGFLVRSLEDEEMLRAYETDAYEVVRCRMEMEDGLVVPACTFRFVSRGR